MAPPLLSVVVPVYNQATSIVENVQVIHERVSGVLGGDFEIIVVSDGSVDHTQEELLEHDLPAVRVLHYDRNLGKGYAIKVGALEAHGRWIGFVDADLDLDPADLPAYVEHAERHDLDFAIGSKRHPESQVHYPPVRVATSWLFQQLTRLLFRLDVRDTQVGLKVFRREIAEQVLPLLLVKRYAFDIELLAVSRAFGFSRVEEMPVRLDYRFTGSGVRSRAVLRALVDTAAIFYRLRVLRYYQRRRAIAGAFGWTRPRRELPTVSVLVDGDTTYHDLGYPESTLVHGRATTAGEIAAATAELSSDVVAILEPRARPAANWLSATVPFFARTEIGAVVVPKLAPLDGTTMARAAAAIDESRIGAGLGYIRYTPGNVRYVSGYPTKSLVVRREALQSLDRDVPASSIPAALAAGGWNVLYTPDTVIVADPAPLFRPHLAAVWARGVSRGREARRGRFGTWRGVLLLAVAAALVGAISYLAAVDVVVVAGVVYAAAVLGAVVVAALRHRSAAVGGLALVGIPCTHVVYAAAFVCGFAGLCAS